MTVREKSHPSSRCAVPALFTTEPRVKSDTLPRGEMNRALVLGSGLQRHEKSKQPILQSHHFRHQTRASGACGLSLPLGLSVTQVKVYPKGCLQQELYFHSDLSHQSGPTLNWVFSTNSRIYPVFPRVSPHSGHLLSYALHIINNHDLKRCFMKLRTKRQTQ